MWESGRDFQRVWEGWKAGIMAFHAFHTLSFPWPVFRAASVCNQNASMRRGHYIDRTLIPTQHTSMSALTINHEKRYAAHVQVVDFPSRWSGILARSVGLTDR
jgi:hypothetical protein